MNVPLDFNRMILLLTHEEVRRRFPDVDPAYATVFRDARAKTSPGQWIFILPAKRGRKHSGRKRFAAWVTASDEFDAEVAGWREWLDRKQLLLGMV